MIGNEVKNKVFIMKDTPKEQMRKKEYKIKLKKRGLEIIKECSNFNYLTEKEIELLTDSLCFKKFLGKNNDLYAAISDIKFLKDNPKTKQKIYVYNKKVLTYICFLMKQYKLDLYFKFFWEEINVNDKYHYKEPILYISKVTEMDYIEIGYKR